MVYKLKYPACSIVVVAGMSFGDLPTEQIIEYARSSVGNPDNFDKVYKSLECAVLVPMFFVADDEPSPTDNEEKDESKQAIISITFRGLPENVNDQIAHMMYLITGMIGALKFCDLEKVFCEVKDNNLILTARVPKSTGDNMYKIAAAFLFKFGYIVDSDYELDPHENNVEYIMVYPKECSTITFDTKEDYDNARLIFTVMGRFKFVYTDQEVIIGMVEKLRGSTFRERINGVEVTEIETAKKDHSLEK